MNQQQIAATLVGLIAQAATGNHPAQTFPAKDLPKTDGSLSRLVERLVRETNMSYPDIVAEVKSQFPHAQTTTKSVASVACVMRKKGTPVPLRLKLNLVD